MGGCSFFTYNITRLFSVFNRKFSVAGDLYGIPLWNYRKRYCATCGKSMQVRYEKVGRTDKNRFTGEMRELIDCKRLDEEKTE